MISIKNLSVRTRSFLPLTAGLTVSQAIATGFIWHANHDLLKSMDAMKANGWLAIPAGPAAATLKTFGAAFWGGLFFTLSIGTGLALATWSLLYLRQQLFHDRRQLLWVLVGLWLVLVAAVNAKGWVLFPTLFIVGTPLAAAAAAIRTAPVAKSGKTARLWPLPLVTLALLTGMWATQFNQQLFITIRDHLLLSNPIGMAVNDFYYRYTLYAAQSFKSFDQKTVRAWELEGIADDDFQNRLTAVLARYDILATPGNRHADMLVSLSDGDDMLMLTSPQGGRLDVKTDNFFADPNRWISQFSALSDRFAPFRRMTFFGLLLGFPILLYVLVDGAIGRLAGSFSSGPVLIWIRSGLCLTLGIFLLVPVLAGRQAAVSKEEIQKALKGDTWPQRVAALRLIEKEKLEIARYPQYRQLIHSPWVVERYYTARALAVSRDPSTYKDLMALMRDAHLNVVCQAYYALGRRGHRAAIATIKTQMIQSAYWYSQWYGYRAMRRLGWHQSHSISAP